MQVSCRECHRPYAVNKEQVYAFLDEIHRQGLKYENSFCPHCGKRNRHTRKQLMKAFPGWSPPETEK